MLRRWSSQTPLVAGLVEHECPRCHRPVELPLGQLCKTCLTTIDKRARIVGMVGVLIWYVLSNVIVRRVMGQWQR